MPGNTVRDALEAAVDALAAAGCDKARLDAEILLAQATGWDRARLAAEPEARLPVGASREFGEMVRRRVRREPIAYILGRKGFRRIELLVDRRVLIPRPESELLVELAVELAPSKVLDVGTGSGAIALAVADELDGARSTAIDTSFDAVRVAQANAERLGLTDRVDVVLRGPSSLKGAEPDGRPFDLLLANLPYVSEDEWEELAPEIREYEPRAALVAGPTGLEAIDALAEELFGLAPRPAVVALEIGAGQADEVSKLIGAAGYGQIEVRQDLAGHDRVVIGR
ncbi:MAG TPA: peptide chain release factor N(5)-glutamine methyltransferase [Solirubrobacterales bacterium]|nr:peptide chain release factor N(5)-glutamine methyltransferase [Solirubrobacterales bacterium]